MIRPVQFRCTTCAYFNKFELLELMKRQTTFDTVSGAWEHMQNNTGHNMVAETIDEDEVLGQIERTIYDTGECCMANHANAVPGSGWSCDCPCHRPRKQEGGIEKRS